MPTLTPRIRVAIVALAASAAAPFAPAGAGGPGVSEPTPSGDVPASVDAGSGDPGWGPLDSPAPVASLGSWFQPPPSGQDQPPTPEPGKRLRSWELPPVTVVGTPSALREEERVGTYGQPRWTATRRFATTRVYVIPEGKLEVEGWVRATIERDGVTKWRFLQEVEVGLPYRFQLDLYLRQDYDTESDDLLWGGQFEVRWALADWGKIWGNPTLYFEYISLEDRPDQIEPKLLLGGEIAERWHWAANLVAEFQLSGEEEYEYQVNTGLSYTLIDSQFSIGIEDRLLLTDTAANRGNFSTTILIGPSIQWRPVPQLTLNFAPLVGVTGGSPAAQIWFNCGWEF